MEYINLWAVLLAAVSAFLVGGLWYSPKLFGNVWCREAGVDPEKGGHPAKVFGVSFVFALIAALAFAWWLGPAPGLVRGLYAGLLAGAGMVAASFGINYQFANRSFTLLGIDGGYHIVQFVVYGLILGLWQ